MHALAGMFALHVLLHVGLLLRAVGTVGTAKARLQSTFPLLVAVQALLEHVTLAAFLADEAFARRATLMGVLLVVVLLLLLGIGRRYRDVRLVVVEE